MDCLGPNQCFDQQRQRQWSCDLHWRKKRRSRGYGYCASLEWERPVRDWNHYADLQVRFEPADWKGEPPWFAS